MARSKSVHTDPRQTSPEGPSHDRKIPPLVWIVLAVLVAWFIYAGVARRGVDHTPRGGTMPRAAEPTSIMPAAPAHDGAPATPGGTVNGPKEPPNSDAGPQ